MSSTKWMSIIWRWKMIKKIWRDPNPLNPSLALPLPQEVVYPQNVVFLDLEHYIYRKPVCIGIFGAARQEGADLVTTQFFLQNKQDLPHLVHESRLYLEKVQKEGATHLVAFAAKNDWLVLEEMFFRFDEPLEILDDFEIIDLQRVAYKEFRLNMGLGLLEELAGVDRQGEEVSGSTLAKTFAALMEDPLYCYRMPKEKMSRFLSYNHMDVLNMAKIFARWDDIDRQIIRDIQHQRRNRG
ncbi:hypothetical protein ABB02_00257 [Clostridiaceae bacterium JG1575]|nr:hypothetical protein ABB02_00257 [Clostridiaceae bacterium JG1575]